MTKRLAWFACVVPLALSCAAHNSHRIEIDLAREVDPLVDQAFARMEVVLDQPLPDGSVGTAVEVEEVEVTWIPVEGAVGQPPVVEHDELVGRIESELRRLLGPRAAREGGETDLAIRIELLLDLNVADEATLQIVCDAVAAKELLGRGHSDTYTVPRLFCHGCRESWSRMGTDLRPEALEVGGFAGAHVNYTDYGGGKPTYTKVKN